MMMSQSLAAIFPNEISLKIPALLTTMSMRPKVSIAVFTILSPNSTLSKLATAFPPAFLISWTTLSAA